MGENQLDCSNDWISKVECHARGFVSLETPAWNQGSIDDRVSNSAYHSSAVSQSHRAGMTQRAIRTPSYLKRPSCLSMKPTVARRFSHWDNVPTLQGLRSQPSQSSLSPKCRPKSSRYACLARSAQPVSSSSRPCRSLTNCAGGRFCGTARDKHPVPTATQPRLYCLCARQTPV